MTNARDLILFFIVTFCILTAWSVFVENPKQLQQQNLDTLEQLERNDADVSLPEKDTKQANRAGGMGISDLVAREHLVADSSVNRIRIKTEKLSGSIALTGAVIDDLTLNDYKATKDSNSPSIVLLSPLKAFTSYYSRFGWISSDAAIRVPDAKSVWNSNGNKLTENNAVTLTWDNREGQIFKLTLSVDDKYMFTITQTIENNAPNEVSLYPFGMINRIWDTSAPGYYILHEGALGTMDTTLSEVTYDNLKEDENKIYRDGSGWFGLTDKYWLTAIFPDQSQKFRVNFKHKKTSDTDRFQVDFLGPNNSVAANGGRHETTHQFFAGAKEIRVLDHYTNEHNITLFDRAIDFGVLYVITKPMFIVLQFFNGYLGNFGLAIMALTIVMKLFLFPLANKSYRSFAHMKKLAPDVEKIRNDFKEDRQAQSQQIMALYRREKVNPVAGCLPIIIQIPVFFALYKVLFVTIEMRHAPFYGWITDLSAPDPTTIFNLFGLIAWNPPGFLMIGVLPLLMSITMMIQQKLNPPPSDPIQAKVITYLPWIFLFLFASFPAGLVLYWVWNNVLSIMQQWTITRIIMKEK